ncbi:MAG: universal stress protein [Humibacillus sp.]|nr:universal stress protein [Humibacillus sp.]MDN5778611.1 universal stress protein [Humibacillus sp.]
MTILVGYPPGQQGRSALELGAMLARSFGTDLVVTTVVPAPWLTNTAQVDAEYLQQMGQVAEEALEQARAQTPTDVSSRFVRRQARSGPSGLLEAAAEHDATMIVLGSSTAGMFGHITMSSVASRLLHSSPLPIALATRGFRCPEGVRVSRVTVAYGGTQRDEALVAAARLVASRVEASLRLALLAVQARPPVNARFGVEADDVAAVWTADMQASARRVLAQQGVSQRVAPQPPGGHQHLEVDDLEIVVGQGISWGEALDDIGWEHSDVLTVGSGSAGAISRVFLGSRAAKIIRDSPVPVVVVPRVAAAAELAKGADD